MIDDFGDVIVTPGDSRVLLASLGGLQLIAESRSERVLTPTIGTKNIQGKLFYMEKTQEEETLRTVVEHGWGLNPLLINVVSFGVEISETVRRSILEPYQSIVIETDIPIAYTVTLFGFIPA